MTFHKEFVIFYLALPKSIMLLKKFKKSRESVNFIFLRDELKRNGFLEAELLKHLWYCERLGLVEKTKDESLHCFKYKITIKGEKVIEKYLELFEILEHKNPLKCSAVNT